MGLLTDQGPPQWHPAPKRIKLACRLAVEYCQSKRVSISKLATFYSLNFPGAHSCLTGVHSIAVLRENLAIAIGELSDKEVKVKERIMRRFLDPLANANWEDLDVERYWEIMRQQGRQHNQIPMALAVRFN